MYQELKLHLQTTCPFKTQMQQMSRYFTILLSLENKTFICRNHLAIQEGMPFIPCRVIPYWLPPNDSYKKLEIDFSTLKFGETILPEQLGLTVAQIGFNKCIKQ